MAVAGQFWSSNRTRCPAPARSGPRARGRHQASEGAPCRGRRRRGSAAVQSRRQGRRRPSSRRPRGPRRRREAAARVRAARDEPARRRGERDGREREPRPPAHSASVARVAGVHGTRVRRSSVSHRGNAASPWRACWSPSGRSGCSTNRPPPLTPAPSACSPTSCANISLAAGSFSPPRTGRSASRRRRG